MSAPIRQSETYHQFSDSSIIFGVQNFWNVASNLPFLLVGLFGISQLRQMERDHLQFFTFFVSICLISIGSGYYHYNPNTETLVWDRLPMTIAFTTLMSIVISEFVDDKKGKYLLFPLILIGILSIVYWIKLDDLRMYTLVQFFPVLAIPVILIFFKSNKVPTRGYWLLLLSYVFAKLFETYDFEIHNTLKFISGHSLKHISASIGVYALIDSYLNQKPA